MKKNVRLAVKTGRAAPPSAPRPKLRSGSAPEPASVPTTPPESPVTSPDLFSMAQNRKASAYAPPAGLGRTPRAEPVSPTALEDKNKFGRYFTSGSFVASRPMGEERRLFRNKAIFMLVFVLLVAFIVASLILWP